MVIALVRMIEPTRTSGSEYPAHGSRRCDAWTLNGWLKREIIGHLPLWQLMDQCARWRRFLDWRCLSGSCGFQVDFVSLLSRTELLEIG